MSSLKPDIMINPCDLFAQIAPTAGTVPYMTQIPELGVRAVTGDGREFRFQTVGATNLVAGTLLQSPAIVANHQNLATVTAAIGATQITVTLGATLATANQYAGGYVVVNAGTGKGQTLRISSNPAAALSTAMVITLEDPLVIATLTADTKVCLYPNLYSGSVINPTSPTGTPVGVSLFNATATYYSWIQVKGIASVLNDAGTTVGLGLAPSTNTAGALFTATATGSQVATALQTGVTTEYRAVELALS